MPVYTEQVELSQVGSIFLGIEQQFMGIDYSETLRDVIPDLEKDEQGQFAGEMSANGTKWPPLSDTTIAIKGHDTILVDTGRLKSSLVGQTPDSIRETSHRGLLFGTSVPYSIFHDKPTANRPQRQHVGIGEQTVETIVNKIADATVNALKE